MHIVQTKALENQDFYYQLVQPDHFWFEARLHVLKQILKLQNISFQSQIGLEIGCGNSLLSSQLEQIYSCTIDGVDLTNAINRVKTKGRFYQTDITSEEVGISGDRDFIVLFDILEHIDDVPQFLNACLKLLKPGGYLLINVPAHEFLRSRYDDVAGHLRRYDRSLLRKHTTGSELSSKLYLRHQNYWGFFFLPLLILRRFVLSLQKNKSDQEIYSQGFVPPARWVNSILRLLSRFEIMFLMPLNIGTSILAVYQKEGGRHENS